jgi:hypothetical protein
MSRETKLMKAVTEATGDGAISEVAEFRPKGTAGASAAGSLAGGAATRASNWGSGLGIAGGGAAGKALMGIGRDLPPRIAWRSPRPKCISLA